MWFWPKNAPKEILYTGMMFFNNSSGSGSGIHQSCVFKELKQWLFDKIWHNDSYKNKNNDYLEE